MGLFNWLFGRKDKKQNPEQDKAYRDTLYSRMGGPAPKRALNMPYNPQYRDSCQNTDDGFLTSAAVAYATDSTVLGALAGGNIAGAMVGDMLNDSDNSRNDTDFGGGSGGGSGASGNYDSDNSSSYDSGSDSSSYDSGSSDSGSSFD